MSSDEIVLLADAKAICEIGASALAGRGALGPAYPGGGHVQERYRDRTGRCAIEDVAVLCRQRDDPASRKPDTFDDTAPPRVAFDAAVTYLRPDLLRYMNRRIGYETPSNWTLTARIVER